MGYFITLIAKYYFDDYDDGISLSDVVKKKLLEFNLPSYQEYKYHNKILNVCNGLYKENDGFKEREYIPLYENELKIINSLENDRQKKLMFTFFIVARYMDCDGWINKKTSRAHSEVFKLANVTLTSDKQSELLHWLYINGYISFAKKIDNLNIKVQLDPTGDIVYKLTDFSNVGNQYIAAFKKGYKQCVVCGKKIRITGKNHKYCKKCSEEIDADKNRKRVQKFSRNNKN